MNYQQLKQKHQDEFEAFPIFFAFNQKQFADGMKKLSVLSRGELLDVGYGGYIRKIDEKSFDEMLKRHEEEKRIALQDKEFLIGALRYELANHEYCITYDASDALVAVGISLDSDFNKKCFEEALIQYWSGIG